MGNSNSYDVIVIGCGGVGSSTAAALCRRGLRVLGLEQFGRAHALGSSHGKTRIIRQAYFEHPNYVPLLRDAYRLWDELQANSEVALFSRYGLLEVGHPDGVLVSGIESSVRDHGLTVDRLTAEETRAQFPQFKINPEEVGIYEHNAGMLFVEDCIRAQLDIAASHGAELRFEEPVVDWSRAGEVVTVRTRQGTYHAARLVMCAGPWTIRLLESLHIPIRVLRKHVHWYHCSNEAYNRNGNSPIVYFEGEEGHHYAFPVLDSHGLKVAEHSRGDEVIEPSHIDREKDPQDTARIEAFLADRLTAAKFTPNSHSVCMYSMTPDAHFLLDFHPEHQSIVLAAGLSGHGFKFTPILGELIAEMVEKGRIDQRLKFLGIDRFHI